MSNIAFPYPILGRGDDYIDAQFQVAIRPQNADVYDGSSFRIDFQFDLSDDAILKLIEDGKAGYGFEIKCPKTLTRYVEFLPESGTLELDATQFLHKIEFHPRIFVRERIVAFQSENMNPEYGDAAVDFEPGDFLAATDLKTLNVYFNYLDFKDAIKVKRQESQQPFSYSFDLEGDTVIIGMGENSMTFGRK